MHFMDPTHLLTIGFDADDQGSFAWFTGIMLQIFDVSDPANLTLVHKQIIGSRGTTSDATDDHLAFNYFPSRELLAIPMGICEDAAGSGGSYGQTMTFNGLMVFHVTADAGFTLLGGIDHRDFAADNGGYDGYDCYNWWQNPNSQVKRSVFMSASADATETFVYSLSPEVLKVAELSTLDAPLAAEALPNDGLEAELYCWGW
jgi:hypothetical protein